MKISLEKIMVIFAVSVAAIPVFVIGVLIWFMTVDIKNIASSEFDKIGARTTRQIVDDTLKICKIIYRAHLNEDENARLSMRSRFDLLGSPKLLNKKEKLAVASQVTPEITKTIQLPILSFGQTQLKLNLSKKGMIVASKGEIQKLLKALKNDTGLDFTILQRVDEKGDMLRVATSVSDVEGVPYLGTYIPSTGGFDDGAIVRTLLARKSFSGISRTGMVDYIATYEPILDPYGDVIGAFAYGRSQDSISYLLKYFESIRVGTTGSVWAIELAGGGESIVRVSRDGKRNGTIVEEDTFKERRDKTLEMLSDAVALGEKTGVREYSLDLSGNDSSVIAAYAYFKPWNLVIGASTHKNDFSLGVENIVSSARYFIVLLVSIGVAILFLAGFVAWIAALRGVNMINVLNAAIEKIKNGDIASARKELALLTNPKKWSNSEIYRSAVALNSMSKSLTSLVSKVQFSSTKFADSSEKISEGAANIDAISIERAKSLSEVSETIKTIAKSVVLLSSDAREAAKNMETSLSVMSDGGNLLSRLSETSAPLLSAADSVSARLAVIKDKTERISASISTINAVGERTNMLSLNAAIESERAAESGGFESVSAEISMLADRTAASAMNVSKMVAEMADSVELGVSEMDNFSEKMKLNFSMIRKLNVLMSAAESQIAELGPKFESLAASIAAQEENVSNIGGFAESLESFAEGAREKVDALKEVTASITRTSEALVEKVSRFNLGNNDFENDRN